MPKKVYETKVVGRQYTSLKPQNYLKLPIHS